MRPTAFRSIRVAFAFVAIACGVTRAVEPSADAPPAQAQSLQQSVTKAIDFLRTNQASDGSFSAPVGPAVTALVTTAVIRHGRPLSDPMVAKSLKYLEGFVQPDGGIYKDGSRFMSYETCLAVLCFSEANKDKRYDKIIKGADKYLKGLQLDEGEGHDRTSLSYGGGGYGGKSRPDLSNTGYLIDALKATGNGPEDDSLKKALIFVSRCQNLESEHNTSPFPAKNPDGGFYYTVAAGGASAADKLPNGGLRSYGTMTYAGLKSMIYAGVGPDDPRVKAAFTWIQKNYALDSNPGMGTAGLYYYYHTFAKSLDAIGKDTVEDADGKQHEWRAELTAELVKRQQPNGSWLNENHQWLEGDANLATGFALLALSYGKKP